MTLFEALKFNREPLEMLISLGGKQDDLRFIDLYTEYEVMKKQGEKTTYAVAFLANKYSVSDMMLSNGLESTARSVQCD